MAQLPAVAIAGIVSAVTAVAGTAYTIANKPKAPLLPPPVQRDDASAMLNQQDQLAQRRGGASDFLNGDAGTAPTIPGPKQLLGT